MAEEATHAEGQLLRQLEERLLDPVVRRSGMDVAHLLADEFIEFGSSGNVFDKRQVIEALLTEPPTERLLTDFNARSLAPDVVLVTYRVSRHTSEGRLETTSLRSSIWKRVRDHWQMVFHQGTPVRE